MGSNTQLNCQLKLRKDVPKRIINILLTFINDSTRDSLSWEKRVKMEEILKQEHDFFKCERWSQLLYSTNGSDIQGGRFYKEKENWIVNLHTEFKNYDGEIWKFIEWISPFVESDHKQCIGWYKHEGVDYEEENLYIEKIN